VILDFSRAEGDKIDLSGIDANIGTADDDSFTLVASFTGTAGELIVTRSAGVYTVLGDVDGDGVADFGIEVHSAAPLGAADFTL